jgi:hypothetical protein
MEQSHPYSLSMFLPMERAGKETRQNAIRLKNMLQTAEDRLVSRGIRPAEIQDWLAPARNLYDDDLFWQYQASGLALFLSPEMFRSYRLPLQFEELLVLTERFHVKPLLPLFTRNGHFYILALSQNAVRLLHGTRHTVDEVALPPDMPTSMAEALRFDDPEKGLQFRTNVPSGKGDAQAPAFHGHADPDERVNLLRYFLEVDRGISEVLKHEQAPLVLAGVDYLLPLYRERNSYPHLLEEGITGNPDTLKAEELHAQAKSVVHSSFLQEEMNATDQYFQQVRTPLTSSDLRQIVPAACYGKVETLFVAVDVQKWGQFDAYANTIELHEQVRPGDQDLLDFAAVHTILNGGNVYAINGNHNDILDNGPVAALFRYETQSA